MTFIVIMDQGSRGSGVLLEVTQCWTAGRVVAAVARRVKARERALRGQGRAKQDQPCLTRGPVTARAGGLPGQWREQETLIPVVLYYYLFMAV